MKSYERTYPPAAGTAVQADDSAAQERHSEPAAKGKKFPCHSCGAGFEWDPRAKVLTCPYCGSTHEIPQSAEQVSELSFQQYFDRIVVPKMVLENSMCEVKCNVCGAIVEMPASVAADNCTFCNAHLENPPVCPEPMHMPNGLLPFRIDQRDAQGRFYEWVSKRWFAPNDLKKIARLGRLTGMYVPFWTYDTMTISFYKGERGEHYWETYRDSKGQTQRRMKTRWYPASGRIDEFFDDVLVCASQGLPKKHVHELQPWDLPALVDPAPQYLAGFRAERYQIDARQGFDAAKELIDERIRELVRRDIGGDTQRIHWVKTQYEGITFKHILLPVWIAAYDYYHKVYRVLVNARTGEVQGDRPYSWIKITLAVIAALIIVGIVVAIASLKG